MHACMLALMHACRSRVECICLFIAADDKYRRAFLKGGGIAQLVKFLDV